MKRIAFFGGSFDPPHRGHLAIATAAADRFALDQVLFAPVGSQPFKLHQPATPFLHRYAMTVLATQSDPRFFPSLLDTPGKDTSPNYTVDTITRLRNTLSKSTEPTELFVLLGADSWLQIARWHQSFRLLSLAHWIVAARPGFDLTQAAQALPPGIAAEPAPDEAPAPCLHLHHSGRSTTQVFFLHELAEDLSATALRTLLEKSSTTESLLPAAVQNYIHKTGLYRGSAEPI